MDAAETSNHRRRLEEIEAKYGTQVETTVIRALVERDREQMKAQSKLVSDIARVRQ